MTAATVINSASAFSTRSHSNLAVLRENFDWKIITNNGSFFELKDLLRGKVSIHEENIHKYMEHPYWTDDFFESLNTRRDRVNHFTPTVTD